jgi:coenzyme F420-0:L-glutamate ligase/coenzyme F420-1:gamma-L-glutamate ligase
MPLTLTALMGIPLIQEGDSIPGIILESIRTQGMTVEDGDIFVIAQKIVSKSEGRMVDLSTVEPSEHAVDLSKIVLKDPRFVELVLRECNQVLRARENTLIVEHKNGFICANAGIDHSNVQGSGENPEDWFLLLPEDSDRSADQIRTTLETATGKRVGILIIDSHGRAWRIGTVGISIGLSGMPGLLDLRGKPDLFGFNLKITQVGVADELAAAASLMMGQAAEGSPVIHVRGFPYPLRQGNLQELIRPADQDLFR